MANRPHVPKFGDWSNQDQPFTVVFDNARTNKRQDLYESLEKRETKTPAQAPPPPQPTRRTQKPEPPKPIKEDLPRAPPPKPVKEDLPRAPPPKPVKEDLPRAPLPTDKNNKVRAPPADQLYGGGGVGGLYGGYGGGGGSVGNQRQPPPPRPPQQKRGGNNGRGGTTIPPFPGSVGSSENMSYTHIFDQVKEERNREGGRAYGGTAGNTPSRPINSQRDSPTYSSSKVCCFPWGQKGAKY